jgi:hypothetical protein
MALRGLRKRVVWRAGLAATAWVLLGACADGYPDEDVPPLQPALMARPELLQAMNRLGSGKHLQARWRYALDENCVLERRVRNGAEERQAVPLQGAAVAMDAEDGDFQVIVRPRDGADSEATLALASREWTDAVVMQSLLTHLKQRCSEAVLADP